MRAQNGDPSAARSCSTRSRPPARRAPRSIPCKAPLSVSPLPSRRGTIRTYSICIVPAVAQHAGSSRSVSPSWSSSRQLPQFSGGSVVVLVVDDETAVVDVEVAGTAVVVNTLEVVVVGATALVVEVLVGAARVLVVVVLAAGTGGTAHSSSPNRPSSALKKSVPPTFAGDSG